METFYLSELSVDKNKTPRFTRQHRVVLFQ